MPEEGRRWGASPLRRVTGPLRDCVQIFLWTPGTGPRGALEEIRLTDPMISFCHLCPVNAFCAKK